MIRTLRRSVRERVVRASAQLLRRKLSAAMLGNTDFLLSSNMLLFVADSKLSLDHLAGAPETWAIPKGCCSQTTTHCIGETKGTAVG